MVANTEIETSIEKFIWYNNPDIELVFNERSYSFLRKICMEAELHLSMDIEDRARKKMIVDNILSKNTDSYILYFTISKMKSFIKSINKKHNSTISTNIISMRVVFTDNTFIIAAPHKYWVKCYYEQDFLYNHCESTQMKYFDENPYNQDVHQMVWNKINEIYYE